MGVDNDIPKDLAGSISDLFGSNTNVTLKKFVKAEYKNAVERKVLVLTDHRVILCANKVPSKIEFSLHFLELQGIESTDIKLVMKTEGRKLVVFAISNPDEINEVVFQISDSLIQIFPHMTLQKLTGPLDISPPARMKQVTDKLKSKTLLRESSPCGNFSAQYRCMCDLHNLPFLDEVGWDVDTIYLSQNCKWLILSDFDHLEAKHLVPIIGALRHNTWFTTLCSCNVKLTPDAMNEYSVVLKTNTTIEHVCTLNSGGRSEFVQKIASALTANMSDTAVNYFDFKGNAIEDKGAQHLCPVISTLTKGVVHLELSKCRLTHLSANRLAGALCSNAINMTTLTYLNLSGNSLKDDITNFHNFLAQPNALTQLNLSGTECALDNIFGALYRGCSLKLEHLNLSNNVFTSKKMKGAEVMVPVSWKQYFASALALRSVSVAETRLPLEAVKNMLLGISSNEQLSDVTVNLRSTGLGEEGARLLEMCMGDNQNITELDISDNGFDQHTVRVVKGLGTNTHLKKLCIGKNFTNLKPKHIPPVIEAIVDLVSVENSSIESLSVADSKLKADTVILINAVGGNTSLTELDISGNGFGDYGARMLSKALQINNKLQILHWDNNSVTPQGYTDVAWAMTRNFCLRKMPTPLNDLTAAQRMNQKKTHKAWHQIEESLLRNNSPRRFGSEQAYRLQQGFLLSTSQQAIDKYIVQLLDCIEDLEKGETSIAIINEIGIAKQLMKDAENCRQLLVQLQKIGLKCEESGNAVENKLKVMAEELQECLETQLKSTLSNMQTCVEGKCLSVLENKPFEEKIQAGSEERVVIPKSFCSTVLLEQVATEIYNKTSEVNVSVASYISEELIEGLLEALEKCSKNLTSHQSQESGLDREARQSILRRKPDQQQAQSQATTDYRKSVKINKLRPVSTVSPSAFQASRISEDESSEDEDGGHKASPDEQTDTTDTNSVDSLLEESVTKPEKKEDKKKKKEKPVKSKPASPKKSPPKAKTEVKVSEFDNVASTDAPKLVHLNKERPKRHNVRRPMQRREPNTIEDTDDVGEGMLDFYKTGVVVKEHVVPSTKPSPKQKEEHPSKTSTTEEKPEPKKRALKPPKTKLPGIGGFGKLFKSSKSQENVTSPPKEAAATPDSGTPSPESVRKTTPDSTKNRTPESPVKPQLSQKGAAPKVPVVMEKKAQQEEEVEDSEEEAKEEEKEPEEEKPKEEPPKVRLPPGVRGMPGMPGMPGGLLAEMKTKRNTMGMGGGTGAPPKRPPPSKMEAPIAEAPSKPEVKERPLKPPTQPTPKSASAKEPSPSHTKPIAPARPPSFTARLSSDTPAKEKSPARSLSSSNTEEKKKEEVPVIKPLEKKKSDEQVTKPPEKKEDTPPSTETKQQPERQAPQPPTRPNRPARPVATPVRSQTVPVTKPPGGDDSGSDGRPKSGGSERTSQSLRSSSSKQAPASPATTNANGDVPNNDNNNTLTTTPSKSSKPAVPARPPSKNLESPKVTESPQSSDESEKRASSTSGSSSQEQDSKHNSKEFEVSL